MRANGEFRGETRWDRGAWVALALACLLVLWPLVQTLLGLRYPADGWTSRIDRPENVYRLQYNLAGRPSPLQRDDAVLRIDGREVIADQRPPVPERLVAGQVLRYTVQRDERTLDVDVPLLSRGPSTVLRYVGSLARINPSELLISYLSLVIAGLVFVRRPGNYAARLLLWIFSYYLGSVWFGLADFHFYNWTYPAPLLFAHTLSGLAWGWFFFAALIQLVLVFPVRLAPMRHYPRLLPAVLHGVPAATAAVGAAVQVASGGESGQSSGFLAIGVPALLFLGALGAAFVYNFRTVRHPATRAQLRWIALGLGAGWGLSILLGIVDILVPTSSPVHAVLAPLGLWPTMLLPLSLAIAITRYRLFDIDVIIRRTLVYTTLTALLGAIYLGSVVLLQRLLGPLVGENNQIAVVASTLAIAALFQPLRHRIQAVIDRRFYRGKYDAARIVQAFGAGLRDETDLDEIRAGLLRVVDATLQPAQAGVWLRNVPRRE